MKITVSYSKKIGQDNYGSIGALVAVEEEFDADFSENPADAIRQKRTQLFAIAKEGVDQQLKDSPKPQPQQAQQGPPQKSWGNNNNAAGPQKSWAGAGNGQGGGNAYGPPKTGAGLYKWAKGLDETNGTNLVNWINSWAKNNSLSGPWKEWPPDAVTTAYALAKSQADGPASTTSTTADDDIPY